MVDLLPRLKSCQAGRAQADAALTQLSSAMQWCVGNVPELTGTVLFDDGHFAMTRDAFRFTTPGGVEFGYRRGESVTVAPVGEALTDERELYLWGTVFGAVAWLNRLVPLHASGLVCGGQAIAITAPSGGGKSTLAAALSSHGFSYLSDDTLPLSLDAEGVFALPDGKPIKLHRDSLELLALQPTAPITSVPGKFYVAPPGRGTQPAPLRHLFVLDDGPKVAIEPISGSDKFEHLLDTFYRDFVHLALGDEVRHRQILLDLSRSLKFWRLSRPMSKTGFHSHVAEIGEALAEICGGCVPSAP